MKISILLLLLTFSTGALAKTVARVLEINGNAFVFYGKKDSKRLFYGDRIEDMSEIMVDDSSTISIKDEFDRVFHIAGGSYVKVFNNLLELKNGNVWVTSQKGNAYGVISSVNSVAKFTQGHFVYSFDNMSGKSQALVLTGDVKFSNVVEPDLSVNIPAGHFSFVDQKTANGLPRGATRVGLTSYKQVKGLFTGLKGLEKTNFDKALFGGQVAARGIASVPSDVASGGKKGKLIFIETNASRGIASVGAKEESAYDYYKSIKKTVSKKTKKIGAVAKVRMFGFTQRPAAKQAPKLVQKQVKAVKKIQAAPVKAVAKKIVKKVNKAKSNRTPASVEKSKLIQEINANGAFEKSLNQANHENKRHPEEVNQLIDELKSYDQTYDKNY